ncbi:Uncharacterised protein [Candidatus Bilamarchaeum dharawalense]|uniref:Uncharacterized protein n=1 Tax=Candidatus Bilamarchaeum dharawalense TaxID=2885759 RepID=A0A5E4LT90_9ARCH|nr:Uncharacterised protein [Candidatus Bilamarchaeum dharawalense]
MKRIFVILFAMALLILGCTGQTNIQQNPPSTPNTTPPQSNNQTTSCDSYCRTAVAPSCNGSWNISGTYPDCNCHFSCLNVVITNDTQNNSTPPLPPDELPKTPVNFTKILDNALSQINNEFYSDHSGMFNEKTHTWYRISGPGDSFDTTPSEVKFNGKSIATIQASGFTIFDGADSTDIFGVAIFNATTTSLDNYGFTGSFDITYTPKLIDGTLSGCVVYNKQYTQDSAVTYYFECEKLN